MRCSCWCPRVMFIFQPKIGIAMLCLVILNHPLRYFSPNLGAGGGVLFYSLGSKEVLLLLLLSCFSHVRLCDPRDGSPLGSPIPGILQARTLEWVAISFSSAWKWKLKVKSLSCVRLFTMPWTAAHQAPPSMGFSRQGYWSGVPLPSPKEMLL